MKTYVLLFLVACYVSTAAQTVTLKSSPVAALTSGGSFHGEFRFHKILSVQGGYADWAQVSFQEGMPWDRCRLVNVGLVIYPDAKATLHGSFFHPYIGYFKSAPAREIADEPWALVVGANLGRRMVLSGAFSLELSFGAVYALESDRQGIGLLSCLTLGYGFGGSTVHTEPDDY